MKRRKHIDPSKAAAAAGGDPGWYAGIPVVDTRPACSRCGTRTAMIDQEHSECLRCVLARRKEARTAAPEAPGPF